MANVPWHEEVVRFVCELVNLIPDYEIACEHEHSNCLLIAHKKVRTAQVCVLPSPLSLLPSLFSLFFPSPYYSEILLVCYLSYNEL